MEKIVICPHCGRGFPQYANPTPTTDVIIYTPVRGVVMIERKNPPPGFALPGGFIEEGEQAEEAAVREMREETGLDVELTGLLGVYSRPDRDPRQHTLSVVFTGTPCNPDQLRAGDDAKSAAFYPLDALPAPLAFDHARILRDFKAVLAGKRQAAAVDQTAVLHRHQPQPHVVDYG
ncbi:MAG: NUDIX hydrolase [Desulfovibrio sp.]|jgi:8-oxo-dGTP diphosphatase|nr:NUDIX hydrolase [Desulfovibrio sp.]